MLTSKALCGCALNACCDRVYVQFVDLCPLHYQLLIHVGTEGADVGLWQRALLCAVHRSWCPSNVIIGLLLAVWFRCSAVESRDLRTSADPPFGASSAECNRGRSRYGSSTQCLAGLPMHAQQQTPLPQKRSCWLPFASRALLGSPRLPPATVPLS